MSGHDVRRDHLRFSKICLHFCTLVFVILFGTIIVSESVSAAGSWLDGDPELIELLSSGILGSIICVVIIMIARKRRHDIENQENK